MTRILAAGDHFVLPSMLRAALVDELGAGVDITKLTLPWPVEPFGRIAEVDEASGSEDDLIEALSGITVCVTQMGPITEKVLAASPELKLCCVGRGGPVNVNLEAATKHGVAVCNAPARNATATAEHTVALIMAALRQVPQRQAELLAGEWRSDYYRYDQVGPELAASTVGLVGYGAIGRKVTDILRGFGAEVLVYDPYADPSAVEDVAELVPSLDDLLSRSLIVTLHARVTPETIGLIGREQLDRMPVGSVLVNAARGALLDYDAVCDALHSGRLFAAGFDVFPEEPLSVDSPLRTAPRVVMTPHLAGASKNTAHNAANIVAAEVGRFVRGEPLHYQVNA